MKLSQSIGHANIVQTRSNQTWFIIQILQYQYQYRPERPGRYGVEVDWVYITLPAPEATPGATINEL